MQTTSATWAALYAAGAPLEVRVEIGGTVYAETSAPVISRAAMQDRLSIGNVVSAALLLFVRTNAAIARSAEVVVSVRLNDGETASEWLPAGTFYISRRARDPVTGLLALECYDALLKANAVWEPSSGTWPRSMSSVVTEFLTLLGVSLDSRTVIPSGAAFVVSEPAEGTTIRDVLGMIGQAGGGNWIITPENRLRLVPLVSASGAAEAETDAVDVAGVVGNIDVSGGGTITGVRDTWEGEVTLTGTDSGIVVDVSLPPLMAVEMSDAVLGQSYQAYSLTGAVYDPAAELGDYVRAGANGEISSVLYSERVTLAPAFRGDIGAPEAGELSDEYPYIGANARTLALARASIQQAVETLDDELDQQEIFNRLTDNGAAQGMVLYNGQLYINATYLRSGTIDGSNVNAKLLNIVDANGNIIASFNDTIILGDSTAAHAELDNNSFELFTDSNIRMFYAGDIRNSSGYANVSDTFVGDGSKTTFQLSAGQPYSVTGVTVDGTTVSNYTISSSGSLTFSSAPANKAIIVATYVTTVPIFRYDVGIRGSDTNVGNYSVAAGYGVDASGKYSFAEGNNCEAKGSCSHAEGSSTRAYGNSSHAEGSLSFAYADYSHAEGRQCTAFGYGGHAEGGNADANGNYSHAEGFGTSADSDDQHVSGRYNIKDTSNTYAEIVGNGTAPFYRSNARTLDWNGNEYIAGALSVGNAANTRSNLGTPANTDLTSIIATGTTNATGSTIVKGTYFYLNGALVQAKEDIASNAMFTSGTNYEAVTAGGLNSLSAVSYISVNGGQQSGTIKLVRCGKIRQLVFDDAKLPSNAGYFTIPNFSSSDSPHVLTGAILYINPNKSMFIWIRPVGSIGQISVTPGDIVNGTLTWIV